MKKMLIASAVALGLMFSSIGFAEMSVDQQTEQPMNNQQSKDQPMTQPETEPEQNNQSMTSEDQKYFEVDLKTPDGKTVSAIFTKDDADLIKKGDSLQVGEEVIIDNNLNN